jgi:hypothetical protein
MTVLCYYERQEDNWNLMTRFFNPIIITRYEVVATPQGIKLTEFSGIEQDWQSLVSGFLKTDPIWHTVYINPNSNVRAKLYPNHPSKKEVEMDLGIKFSFEYYRENLEWSHFTGSIIVYCENPNTGIIFGLGTQKYAQTKKILEGGGKI